MTDKRSESQFNQDPFDGGEDPWYSWNSENMPDEAPKHVKHHHISRNAEDIENSKRSRGERI